MKSIVNVAVAIIHYGEKYLLGYRNANQHQGEKYEFIGGKIENFGEKNGETPRQALIREVAEEIGCDISANIAIKMGVIHHDYSEKSVALHCFKVELSQNQFDSLQSGTGKERQAIIWVEKTALLAKKYPLPEANVRILDWLKLPSVIFISQSLQGFDSNLDWVSFYTKNLPKNAVFYCRLQADLEKIFSATLNLLSQRDDIFPLIQFKVWQHYYQYFENQNLIIHLNHAELMTLDFTDLPKNQFYFASCHDKNSLSEGSQLTKTHNVMGCFLSPVLPTSTHPETIANGGMGWEKFSELAEMSDVPVYGLGGLGESDLEKIWENNGFGVAGIRLIKDFVD